MPFWQLSREDETQQIKGKQKNLTRKIMVSIHPIRYNRILNKI